MRRTTVAAGALALAAFPLVRYQGLLPVHGLRLVLGLAAVPVTAALALVRPRLLLVLLVPVAMLCRVEGYGLIGAGVVVALALLLTFVTLLRAVQGTVALRPVHAVAALLMAGIAAGFLLPATGTPAIGGTGHVLRFMLAGVAVFAVAAADPPEPRHLAWALVAGGSGLAVVALVTGGDLHGRLTMGPVNPNFLGAGLVPGVVAAAGLARRSRNPLWLLPAAGCAVPLLATESRGAVLAAAVGLAAVLVSGRPPYARLLITGAAAGAAWLFPDPLGLLHDLVLSHRSTESLRANSGIRAQLAGLAVDLIRLHPLRGVGLGHFPFFAASAPQVGFLLSTHDDYLELAAEAGIPTLAVLLLLLWLGLRPPRTGELAILRCVVAAQAVDMLFANTLDKPGVVFVFWISLGVLLSAEAVPVPAVRVRALVPSPR